MSTFNSGTTVPAVQLELQAQLAQARAEINALHLQQKEREAMERRRLEEDAVRDANYRRMDAALWDREILKATMGLEMVLNTYT